MPSSSSTTESSIVEIPSWTTSTIRPLTTSSSTTTTTTTSQPPPMMTPSIDDVEFPDYVIPPKYIPPRTPSASASFFARPGILAGMFLYRIFFETLPNFLSLVKIAVIGGTVVGLLCAILMVMFIVYRMRKKDEGSYPIDKTTITKTYRATHNHHHHHVNHHHPLHSNKQYA